MLVSVNEVLCKSILYERFCFCSLENNIHASPKQFKIKSKEKYFINKQKISKIITLLVLLKLIFYFTKNTKKTKPTQRLKIPIKPTHNIGYTNDDKQV